MHPTVFRIFTKPYFCFLFSLTNYCVDLDYLLGWEVQEGGIGINRHKSDKQTLCWHLHDQTYRYTDFLDSGRRSHILTYAVRNALEDGQIEKGDSHSEIQMDKLRGVHIDRRETDCSVMKSRLTDRRSKKCVDRRKDRHW